MKQILLAMAFALFSFGSVFSQNIIGPDIVCLNTEIDYRFEFDRDDIEGFRIELIGGNVNGTTSFETGCFMEYYPLQYCPNGELFRFRNVKWTSTGTKRITVRFFNGNFEEIASRSKNITERDTRFTPNLTGPYYVSNIGDFDITGNYSSSSWSVVPSGSGISISPQGTNRVRISGVSNSPYSWHLIRFQGQYIWRFRRRWMALYLVRN